MDTPSETPSPALVPPNAPAAPIRFQYVADGGELFGIRFMTSLLSIVTLGIYYAWGRARELRYVIGAVHADDDEFTFHGHGREIFLGLLKAWAMFLLPLVGLYAVLLTSKDSGLELAVLLGFYAVLGLFVIYAAIGSLRYRSSRTTWRGIRFGFDGTFNEFGAAYLPRVLLVLFSLGIAYPFVATWRRDYVLSHARLGSERFAFDGKADDLFARYLMCWFLAIPTLGLSLAWYHGFQQQYFWNHTRLAGGRFRCGLSGSDWLVLGIQNALLAAVTFGIAVPWIYVRLHERFFGTLHLEGLDVAKLRRGESEGSALGEAAGDLLDSDGGFDLG